MNKDDIEEIYNEYADLIYKYLLCLTRNAEIAEDLTQETFLQAMKGIHKFRGECKLSVWLCQISKNLWYKELRSKERTSISIEEISEMASDDRIEEQYIMNVDKVSFFKALHQLDYIAREIVYLRITGELNFAQIGEIFGQSENWARVSYYRSKQKIMKGMKEYEE